MAIKNEDLIVSIKVQGGTEAKKQVEGVENSVRDMQKTVAKSENAFGGFLDGFVKANLGIFAFAQNLKMGAAAVEDFFSAFTEDSDAATRFGFALDQLSSKQTVGLAQSVNKLAAEMQDLGIAADDQVVSLSAVAAAAGASTKQIENIIKAAAGISTIKPNVSFAEAFNALQMSLKGNARGVSLLAPELANLTEEAMKSGDAIAYLVEKYGPYAQKNLELFSGKTKAASLAFGDIAESSGKAIAQIINLPDIITTSNAAFKAITASIGRTGETLKDLDIRGFAIDIGVATAAYYTATTAIAAYNLGLASSVGLMTSFVIQANLVAATAAKFSLLAIEIGLVVVAIDLIRVNMGNLSKIVNATFTAIGSKIALNMQLVAAAVLSAVESVYEPLSKISTTADAALQETRQAIEKTSRAMEVANKNIDDAQMVFAEIDLGLLGKGVDLLAQSMTDVNVQATTLEKTAAKIKLGSILSDDARKALDEITNKLKEAQKNAASAGLEGVAKINAEAAAANREIDKLADTIRKGSSLKIIPPEALRDINKLKMLTAEAFDKQRIETFRKAADELNKENIAAEYALIQAGGTTQEQLDAQITGQLHFLDLKREELRIKGLIASGTEVPNKAQQENLDKLERQREIAMDINRIQNSKVTRGSEFEQSRKAVDAASAGLQKVFTSGAAGIAGGFMSGVDAFADVIQAFIDFIPGFLNKVAGIFNSLANLPTAISSALGNLIDGIDNFVDNFADNLEKMIPDVIVKIVENIGPIFASLFKSVILDIPVAIVKGIYQAFKKLFADLGNFFKGKLPKVEVDEKSLQNLVKNLTGISSDIFSVENLQKSAGNAVDKIMNQIEGGFRRSGTWLQGAMKAVENAWKKIWNMTPTWLQDVANLLFNPQTWYNLGVKIWNGISDLWSGFWNMIPKGLQDFLNVCFNPATWFTLGVKIFDGLASLWSGLWGSMPEWLRNFTNVLFNPQTWLEMGQKLVAGIGNVFDGLIKVLEKIVSALGGGGIVSGLTGGSSGAGGLVNTAINTSLGAISGGTLSTSGLKIGGKKIFHDGGPVYASEGFFQPKGVDIIPAMVQPGEFIVSKKGVENFGMNNLRSINTGKANAGQMGSTTVNISVNVEARTNVDASYIKNTLVPAMQDELKRASLDGKFVISSRGIR